MGTPGLPEAVEVQTTTPSRSQERAVGAEEAETRTTTLQLMELVGEPAAGMVVRAAAAVEGVTVDPADPEGQVEPRTSMPGAVEPEATSVQAITGARPAVQEPEATEARLARVRRLGREEGAFPVEAAFPASAPAAAGEVASMERPF